MLHQSYLDFCEQLWSDWLENGPEWHRKKDEIPTTLARRFQFDYMPEPYIRFREGTKPLYVLLTNPGVGLPHQEREQIKAGRSEVVGPGMTYDKAALKLGKFYYGDDALKLAAGTRTRAILDLMNLIGADCIVQFESLPFHSRTLPGKDKIPSIIESTQLLGDYASKLTAALRDVSVVGLSAVDSSQTISRCSIGDSSWLRWKASLLGLSPEPDQLKMATITEKGAKVTQAFLYQPTVSGTRGLFLRMGTNGFPRKPGLEALASILTVPIGLRLESANPLHKIEERFIAYFARWNNCLPPDDVANRRRGKILKAGWDILYLFGSNEKGEYLDFYAAHRMTNDQHLRIYDNGEEESLPAFEDFRLSSPNPEEDARLKAEFDANRQRIADLLDKKGFYKGFIL